MEKKKSRLNLTVSFVTSLFYILVRKLLSHRGPAPNHSWIRTEFAACRQIQGPAAAQVTALRSLGLVDTEDGWCRHRKPPCKQCQLSWQATKNENAEIRGRFFCLYFYSEIIWIYLHLVKQWNSVIVRKWPT